jgi:hypothetical protein
MASGKTLDLIAFSRSKRWRATLPADKVDRDRTLNGKARIRARRSK